MRNKSLIIGSRASKLALIQAELIKAALGIETEIKTIKTTGDKILDAPLSKIGDKGLFTKEIEEALLANEIDLAVHSMKDLPTEIPVGLKITAITERLDATDLLVSKSGLSIDELPSNSKVGTSSLRRRAQLLNKRPDLQVADLRGNLDTRIRKLEQGQYDAIIVAGCGIERLGLKVENTVIPFDDMLPQAGQGALGIETRACDKATNEIVKTLDNSQSRIAVEAERELLNALGGGCQVPIGIYAEIKEQQIIIKAGVFSLDGKEVIRDEITGDKTENCSLALKLANRLLEKGARKILAEVLG